MRSRIGEYLIILGACLIAFVVSYFLYLFFIDNVPWFFKVAVAGIILSGAGASLMMEDYNFYNPYKHTEFIKHSKEGDK